jgi:hypothetical protein
MKSFILTYTLIFATVSFAQKGKTPYPDIADFNRKFELAKWLYAYDMVAWQTSDSVMKQDKSELARLGSEWFCFQQNDTWHAVYGKYQEQHFDLVFHFVMENDRAQRTLAAVDTSLLNSYSRALQTANKQIETLKDTTGLRFNQFIRANPDSTLSVWIFPAFQPNSVAVYGGEFGYTLDATGTQILKEDVYFAGTFRGFKVDQPREIWINYRDTTTPTLGAVFFAWYYKAYFTKIVIDNTNSISTPFKTNDGSWMWIHAEKQQGKRKKN